MHARDIMTDKVVCVRPMDSVFDAAELMLDADVSALLVINERREIVGIISEADLIRRAETDTASKKSWLLRILESDASAAREFASTHTRRVADIMTKEVVTATEETPLADLVERMQRHRVKRIPIVRRGILVGVVSRADLVRAVLSSEPKCSDCRPDDRALRRAVIATLDGQRWSPRSPLTVVLNEGVVHLWGFVESPEARDACRVAAESVPGVRQVRNHIRLTPAAVIGA